MKTIFTIGVVTATLFYSAIYIDAQKPEQLSDGLRVGDLKTAGFDETKIALATKQILDGTYPNIHSLLIFKKGNLVYENYFTGDDEHRENGRPLGIVKHTRETLHDIRSISKSVVALAVLHAVTVGKIKSLDEPVFDMFPEHKSLLEGEKESVTTRHLLTMSAGLEWNENVSYEDPNNSERQLNRATDPIGFTLSQKLAAKPGTTFNYNGGLTQLLAEIIKRKCGAAVDQYIAKNIFAPLGITEYTWVKITSGAPSAASGLRLRSRDIAKIGLLIWQDGRWQGKRVIKASLIRDAITKHLNVADHDPRFASMGYGYQLWVAGYRIGEVPLTVPCFWGNGGQSVCLDRENGVMTVATAGNYNQNVKNPAWAIYPYLIFPALIRK